MKKIVMVFGTFDGLHEGHHAFLKEARGHGDHLIVVIPHDRIVERLKGALPKMDVAGRFADLQALDNVDEVVISDEEPGTWEVVKRHRPDVIAIGYDQYALREDLESHLDDIGYIPEIRTMHSYEKSKKTT
jgi:cytidyltransferase-like protein